MSILLQSLTNFKVLQHYDGIKRMIPSTSNHLSREINNLNVELETAGIIVEMHKTRNNSRFIQSVLKKNEE